METRPTVGNPPGLGRPKLAAKDPARNLYRVVGPCGHKEFVVHNNSLNNLKRGLVERVFMVEREGVLVPTPKPESGIIADYLDPIHKELRKWLPRTARMCPEEFVSSYTGRKETMYRNALESLKVTPLESRDSRTSTFVKAEKVPDKAPRVIQPRNTRFHIELGVYIKPMEHRIYKAIDLMNGEGVVAKCLNLAQRGQLIADKWFSFHNPVAIGLDASRFDQHVSVEALQYCHRVYLSCVAGHFERKHLASILAQTLDNSGMGYAKDGCIPYKVLGGRMSGDMDTALGNVVLMCSMVMSLRKKLGLTKEQLKFINDGDDVVLFCEQKFQSRILAAIPSHFSRMGFTMKVEEPVRLLERVEFCQTRPVLIGDSYRMVRIPQTAMAKDLTCILDISLAENFSRWTRAVGECGASISGGVPVLQEFYHSMGRSPKLFRGSRNTILEAMQHDYKYHLYRGICTKYEAVSPETRASFFLAFGIEPDAQLVLEASIRQWRPLWEKPPLVDSLAMLPSEPLITTAR